MSSRGAYSPGKETPPRMTWTDPKMGTITRSPRSRLHILDLLQEVIVKLDFFKADEAKKFDDHIERLGQRSSPSTMP